MTFIAALRRDRISARPINGDPASHFAVPPGRGEKFTLVEVTMFSGRSMVAKNLQRKDAGIVPELSRRTPAPCEIPNS
jgi:hypothetical protein